MELCAIRDIDEDSVWGVRQLTRLAEQGKRRVSTPVDVGMTADDAGPGRRSVTPARSKRLTALCRRRRGGGREGMRHGFARDETVVEYRQQRGE